MKQHYLPQFYLEGFCDPDCPQGHVPFVWKIESNDPAWKKRAPKKIAYIPDMYCFESADGEKRYELDQAITYEEGRAAVIIRNKILLKKILSDEEKLSLSGFIALLGLRIPTWIRFIETMQKDIAKKRLNMIASHPEAFETFKRKIEADTGEKIPDSINAKDLHSSNFNIQPSKNATLIAAMSPITISNMQKIINKMNWNFACTTDKMPFITSDRPFCLCNPELVGSHYGPGLGQKDVELTVPISSVMLLNATWQKRPDNFYLDISKHEDLIQEFNIRTINFSDTMLVSSNKHFPGDYIVDKWLQKKELAENKDSLCN